MSLQFEYLVTSEFVAGERRAFHDLQLHLYQIHQALAAQKNASDIAYDEPPGSPNLGATNVAQALDSIKSLLSSGGSLDNIVLEDQLAHPVALGEVRLVDGVFEFRDANGIFVARPVVSFETVSKNLKQYPASLSYTGAQLDSVTYTTPSGTVTKTLGYTSGKLTTITLSGAGMPGGISTVKTLSYTGDSLSGFSYT